MEVPKFMDGMVLSVVGEETLEVILLGAILGEDTIRALRQDSMRKYRMNIVKSILHLLENMNFGNYSIISQLDHAIMYLNMVKDRNFRDLNDMLSQPVLFSNDTYDLLAVYIAHILQGKERDLMNWVITYNNLTRAAATGVTDLFDVSINSKEEIQDGFLKSAIGERKFAIDNANSFNINNINKNQSN